MPTKSAGFPVEIDQLSADARSPGIRLVIAAGLAALVFSVNMVAADAQAPVKGEDESEALVEEGRRFLQRGDFDDAARALDQAIGLNPRRIEAYVLRAAVHLARKQYDSGIALTRRAQALAPNSQDVLDMLGILLMLDGRTDEGVPILEQVVAHSPGRYDAQGALGRHYASRRNWRKAIPALEAYLKARPASLATSDLLYRLDLANAYLRDGQAARARDLFATTLKSRPDDVRARLGMAWATAALDCRKARTMLGELSELAERYPSVWLVEGQCALAMGNPRAAIRLGRRYVDKATDATAAGHALMGEAHAAVGDLKTARAELARARKLEPQRRRWAVRLAYATRQDGDAPGAVSELEAIGPPAEPAVDPDWWAELGDALLATGQAKTAAARLAPAVPQVARDARLRTVLGDALYRSGDAAAAVKWLEEADALGPTPRSRTLLARALEVVAAGQLKAGDVAAAETSLARAAEVDATPSIDRNLGVARLTLGQPSAAIAPLERSARQQPDAVTWMLLGRARAAAGDAAAARDAYERAVGAARGPTAVEVALDVAAFELDAGQPAAAVAALEHAQTNEQADAALVGRHARGLVVARHAAGLAALRAGEAERAIKFLEAAENSATGTGARAIKCDLALATVAAGRRVTALRRLRQLGSAPCPYPAPANTQAVPILIAFTEGLVARHASRALDRLEALDRQSTGVAQQLLATAIRVVAINAADQAYRSGRIRQARRFLAVAQRSGGQAATDELAHNVAVLDVADGRIAAARTALERLGPHLPEAMVNLGVTYDRQGNPEKALECWRRARRGGVRFGPLAEWIASKELVYGTGGGGL